MADRARVLRRLDRWPQLGAGLGKAQLDGLVSRLAHCSRCRRSAFRYLRAASGVQGPAGKDGSRENERLFGIASPASSGHGGARRRLRRTIGSAK
jgi:hypothetical protein